jgi:hypothetical protein
MSQRRSIQRLYLLIAYPSPCGLRSLPCFGGLLGARGVRCACGLRFGLLGAPRGAHLKLDNRPLSTRGFSRDEQHYSTRIRHGAALLNSSCVAKKTAV